MIRRSAAALNGLAITVASGRRRCTSATLAVTNTRAPISRVIASTASIPRSFGRCPEAVPAPAGEEYN
jgi:hypothetical protein